MRIALGIEYDGSGFHGWQAQQPGVASVQAALETALGRVADHPVKLHCAGRTDTGVHARGQVAHFETTAERPPNAWTLGVNTELPQSVAVIWAKSVDDDFHARFTCVARHYRYVIQNRKARTALWRQRAAWRHQPLDSERMHAAAQHLLGEHDFSSFRAAACQARHANREVQRIEVRRVGEMVVIDLVANAFLHHMVRNIAGVLMAIGCGEREPTWTAELLQLKDRTLGGVTAVPSGLYFMGTRYPERYAIPWSGGEKFSGL
jgi:tRNA pseudouridine38-40 synthase